MGIGFSIKNLEKYLFCLFVFHNTQSKSQTIISTLVCFVFMTSEKSAILDWERFGSWSGKGANANNVILCAKQHSGGKKKKEREAFFNFPSKKHSGKSKPSCQLTLLSMWFLLMSLNLLCAQPSQCCVSLCHSWLWTHCGGKWGWGQHGHIQTGRGPQNQQQYKQ